MSGAGTPDPGLDLLERAPLGVYVVDADGRLAWANAVARAAFGPAPTLGRRYAEIVGDVWPADVAAGILERFRQTLATGEPFSEGALGAHRGDRGVREHYEWRIERVPWSDERPAVVCFFHDVTLRVEAHEALRERGERFHALVDAAPLGIFLVDADLRIVHVNPVARPVFGEVPDVLGRSFQDVMHILWPADFARSVVEIFRGVLASGVGYRQPELVQERADREGVEYFDWRAERLPLPDGRLGVVCTFVDISAQVHARRAIAAESARRAFLLDLNDRLRTLADAGAIRRQAMHLLRSHLGVTRVGYAHVEGDVATITDDDATDGPGVAGVYPLRDFGLHLARSLRAGRPVAYADVATDPLVDEVERGRWAHLGLRAAVAVPLVKDGRLVAILFVHDAAPRAWTDDEVALVEEVADRTWAAVERARAEAAQREAIERFERQVRLFEGVASTTPDFVYLFDLGGRFLYANRRLLEVWGLEHDGIVGRTPLELGYPRWHHDMHMAEIAQVVATKAPIKGEVPFEAPRTGIFGVYEYIFTPVLGPDGEVETVAGTTRDVTERKRLEERLRDDEARHRFLLDLADRIRARSEPEAIMAAAAEATARWLGLSAVSYLIVDPTEPAMATLVAGWSDGRLPRVATGHRIRIADYTPEWVAELTAGRPTFVDDAGTGPVDFVRGDASRSFEVRGGASVPLLRDGGLIAWLFAADPEPRAWTEADRVLLREVADRTWAAVERARADAALRASEERYRILTDALPDIAWWADADGSNLRANRRWYETIGTRGRHLGGDHLAMVEASVHTDDQDEVARIWTDAVSRGTPFEYQARIFSNLRGRYAWFLVRGAPVRRPDGAIVHWVGTTTDIDDQKRVEQEVRASRTLLHHRVHHDPLTGLPNRLLFEDRLDVAMAAAARSGRQLALLFVDIDGFKTVNDTRGHAAGDVVLDEVARRMRSTLRGADTLARLHGDEFAAVLPEVTRPDDAHDVARALIDAVAPPIPVDGGPLRVTASVGVALFPSDASEPRALLRCADVAMYRAKSGGKNGVRFFDERLSFGIGVRDTLEGLGFAND